MQSNFNADMLFLTLDFLFFSLIVYCPPVGNPETKASPKAAASLLIACLVMKQKTQYLPPAAVRKLMQAYCAASQRHAPVPCPVGLSVI
jgi:hypothetical protein